MNRAETLVLLADTLVVIVGAWVGISQEEAMSVFGFCFAGGSLGGALAILIGKERTPPRELAKRWAANILSALVAGPAVTYVGLTRIPADLIPVPILAFTCGAGLGIFGVLLLLAFQSLANSWIAHKKQSILNGLKLNRVIRRQRQTPRQNSDQDQDPEQNSTPPKP